MRGRYSVEIHRGDGLEELALVQNTMSDTPDQPYDEEYKQGVSFSINRSNEIRGDRFQVC